MAEKEVMYLVGDFRPDVLERWTQFAKLTNRTIKHCNYTEFQGDQNFLIILDTHGLYDLPLDPPTGHTP